MSDYQKRYREAKRVYHEQLLLVAKTFWRKVTRGCSSLIILKTKREWQQIKREALAQFFEEIEFGRVKYKNSDVPLEHSHFQEVARDFANIFFTPFSEYAGKEILVFVPEVRTFLRSGKAPSRTYGYGQPSRTSINYYDARIKETEALLARLRADKRRQIQRDEWKSASTS